MGGGDETNLTISQKGEAAAAAEVKETVMQGTENHYAWKMRYPQEFGPVHPNGDSPEPVFKGTVWNTLRTDVKKVLSDLSTRLMRPPSSDVMHMRPLIREELGTIHFGKSEQETSKPLKPTVATATTTAVHSQDPGMLPMSKYFDHSQSQQKVTTPDITPTEFNSITTKSVCIVFLCAVSNCCITHVIPDVKCDSFW